MVLILIKKSTSANKTAPAYADNLKHTLNEHCRQPFTQVSCILFSKSLHVLSTFSLRVELIKSAFLAKEHHYCESILFSQQTFCGLCNSATMTFNEMGKN